MRVINHFYVTQSAQLSLFCLYNREISLAVLLRQTGKTNMTKNCDKIMKCLKNKNVYDIFAISPTPTWN